MRKDILFGSTLSNDRHAGTRFDYMIANPPYGKNWRLRPWTPCGRNTIEGAVGRFAPGLPRVSDGQLLFLLHMLSHAKESESEAARGWRSS